MNSRQSGIDDDCRRSITLVPVREIPALHNRDRHCSKIAGADPSHVSAVGLTRLRFDAFPLETESIEADTASQRSRAGCANGFNPRNRLNSFKQIVEESRLLRE